MIKKIRYFLEYIAIWLFYIIFKMMPWKWASHIGGAMGRFIGPKLAASRKAERHIKLAFPHKSEQEIKVILIGMWDNLGRIFAEYPHLDHIVETACHCPDIEYVDAVKHDGKTGIICGAHLANWEVAPAMFRHEGVILHSIYRRPNNPYVARLLQKMRGEKTGDASHHFEKSKSGMMKMVKAMRQGEHVGMLVDQKYNEGLDSTFFNHAVRTSTAFADLAKKFDCPLHFGRVIRKNKTEFEAQLTPAITLKNSDGTPRSNEDMVAEYHNLLEQWITEYPEQWLWLHRRWRDV